jgi:hypothetical protein
MERATVLITRPIKKGDPTEYTYQWAAKAVQIARDLGYNVIDIQGKDVTYNNVSRTITKYKPRFYAHFGHGCPSSLQGQHECTIVRKYSVDELICMAESPYLEERQRIIKLLNPLGELSCPGICSLDNDPCSPLCTYDTNINLLKDSIIYAVACHSASQLGRCAIMHGVETYVGYSDLLMFPVDTLKSQDMFGDIQITILKELLLGKSVQEAEQVMSELEDSYIRRFKKTKYIALPLLWNKIHRKVLGNINNMVYKGL